MITEEQNKRAGEIIREIVRENEERENNVTKDEPASFVVLVHLVA